MHIIKRRATLSTNQEIKDMLTETDMKGPICLYANSQLQGRGQLGNKWTSEPYKNLTCSFYFPDIGIQVDEQFNLSIYVALAILRTLDELGLEFCQIKWPNDILTDNGKKLCGILIENTLSGQKLKSAIIGIGINVNQTDFPGLPNATSVALETGSDVEVDRMLQLLIANMEQLDKQELLKVDIDEYYKRMYLFQKKSIFQDWNGKEFHGIIQGVSNYGKLQVYDINDHVMNEHDIKEIKFLGQA